MLPQHKRSKTKHYKIGTLLCLGAFLGCHPVLHQHRIILYWYHGVLPAGCIARRYPCALPGRRSYFDDGLGWGGVSGGGRIAWEEPGVEARVG